MLMILSYIFLVIINAGMAHYFAQLPVKQGRTEVAEGPSNAEFYLFGVRVSSWVYNGDGRRILNRYRLWLLVAFIAVETASLSASLYMGEMSSSILIRVPALMTLLLIAFVLYVLFSHRVEKFEIAVEKKPIASSLGTRRLSQYTSVGFEIAIALSFLAPILVLIFNYPMLPDRIPIPWHSSGEADDWLDKSGGVIFSLPLLCAYAQGWFLFIKHGSIRGTLTLPAEHAEEFLRHKEEAFRLTMRLLDWLRLLFGACALLGLHVLFRTAEWNNIVARVTAGLGLLMAVAILVCINYFVSRSREIEKKLKQEAGMVRVERPIDVGHWRAGRLLYYNPSNPALFVESPVAGYTFNLANRWAYLHIGYLVGMALMIVWVLGFV